MAYLPIEDYGIIGNMRTAALVGKNGSIDWMCLPHFDSPSVFAAILDDEKGGFFRIAPPESGEVAYRQFYWPDTNVLVSRLMSPQGVVEIQDFMPVTRREESRANHLVRRVHASRGEITLHLCCRPQFDYARAAHQTHIGEHGAVFQCGDMRLGLLSDVPLRRGERGAAEATFTLRQGESKTFLLRQQPDDDGLCCPTEHQSQQLFESTVEYWRKWIAQCQYRGRWREVVRRSALTLKLLTFEPTGAIVAAPTTSLPTDIGGSRNWDYRFTWIRDASFTLYAFLRLGFSSEAAAFMRWLDARYHESVEEPCKRPELGPLRIMYGIEGRCDLNEQTLDHLSGYRGSAPVRVGNGAHDQLQLDIYGELLDSVYLYNKYGAAISYDDWIQLRALVDWLADNWDRPDTGIWEIRCEPRHFVYSKVMAWVALDRAQRLANKRSFPADEARWRRVRNEIYEEVMRKGWDPNRKTMTQAYGSDCLDSSLLIMPMVFFLAPTDPMMLGTLDAITRPVTQGGLLSDGFLYRYRQGRDCGDGLEGPEGTFNMCSFWLVEALTRAGQTDPRRLDEARLLFEQILGYSNHLGLYAEQTGDSGEALGNFPQGFTHLALISSAFNLDRQLGVEA